MLTELLLAALLAIERILNDKKMWLKIIGNANKQKECVYAYCCSEGRTRSLERQRKQQRVREGRAKDTIMKERQGYFLIFYLVDGPGVESGLL